MLQTLRRQLAGNVQVKSMHCSISLLGIPTVEYLGEWICISLEIHVLPRWVCIGINGLCLLNASDGVQMHMKNSDLCNVFYLLKVYNDAAVEDAFKHISNQRFEISTKERWCWWIALIAGDRLMQTISILWYLVMVDWWCNKQAIF